MTEATRVKLFWLLVPLGFIAVLLFWNFYRVGTSPLGDAFIDWLPGLTFAAIITIALFLGLSKRVADKRR
jgi:hypothetical protein